MVEMSWEEQDAADHAGHWVVTPAHEPLGGRSWRVIRATDRFVVVEVEEEPVE